VTSRHLGSMAYDACATSNRPLHHAEAIQAKWRKCPQCSNMAIYNKCIQTETNGT
jgi:hypothetical protein